MPPKKNPPQYGSQRGASAKPTHSTERLISNASLRATEEEKHATSKTLYGDPTARISSNVQTIHDRIRPRAYQSVLRSIKGKSLLHIGCGMGLLSMLAARNLASIVVAIDRSAIVDAGRVVAEENGLHNLHFFRGTLRETMGSFPVQSFDVILCEWMGALLVNESILEDAMYARDHLLAAGGVMCPDSSSLHVVGVSDYPFYLNTVDYWSNVYGFKMEPMKELVWREVETCSIPAANIVTNTSIVHTCHIQQLTPNTTSGESNANGFSAPFTIRATQDTVVNFLTFYIDATFTNPQNPGANFVIGIRPGGTNAWTETSVALREALPVKAGEAISGEMTVKVLDLQRGIASVEVTARTEGHVVAQETTGTYVYQRY